MRVLHVGHGFVPFHHGGLINYAESLMQAQARDGDHVAYFFSGRRYPLLRRPRLHRWRRGGVEMVEMVNSPVPAGYADRGTADPLAELDAPEADRLFADTLQRVRPDVVHVHDMVGLPSSLLEIPGAHGVPVVMALRDYYTLCPTLKLFDADGENCLRRDPAPMCVRCCRDALPGVGAELTRTRRYEWQRATDRVPVLDRLPRPSRVRALVRRGSGEPPAEGAGETAAGPRESSTPVAAYRARRDTNIARLNGVDRLLALSPRVATIYTQLGVHAERISVLPVGPAHLADIVPREPRALPQPLRMVSLNGGASKEKGAELLADAAERLEAAGYAADELTITVVGEVHPDYETRFAASALLRPEPRYARGSVDRLLSAHDVGVMPSVWEEAMGFAGVEMLAKGLPVIGNALGGMVEYVIDGETGWVNAGCDGAGLAAIVESILADPEQVARLSHRVLEARDRLVRPTPTWLGEVADVYRAVAAARPGGQISSTAMSDG